MIARSACRIPLLGLRLVLVVPLMLASLLLHPEHAAAQRPAKPVQDWLKQHRLLLLPDEVKVLQQLKADDVDEFVRIFWARRSPSPPGDANPYRTVVEKASAEADVRFSERGKRGVQTACGQVLMLLGNPDEVIGRELRATFENRPERQSKYRQVEQVSRSATRDGARGPELWIYKSNARRTFHMSGGDLKLQFDDGCEFEESARTLDELARLAAERVLHPEIRYDVGADGSLRRLAAAPQAASPVRALLDQPRADFNLVFEPKLQVPGQGGAYTAAIVRGGPGSLKAASAGAPVRLRIIARAAPASGPAVLGDERDAAAVVEADGSFVTSYGLTIPARLPEVGTIVLTVTFDGNTATGPWSARQKAGGEIASGTLTLSRK